MTQGPPIERFLGEMDPAGGPMALLGITSGDVSQEAVREALRARLALVDQHPQSKSAEADEVRLALHVAAAQLADALPTPGVDRPADSQRPLRPIVPGERIDPRRRTLLAVVAHSGGWNATARHRVGAVAHAMGLSLDDAIEMLSGPPGGAGAAVPEHEARTALFEPASERLGATPIARLLLGATGLCAVCSLVLAGVIVWIVRSSGAGPARDTTTTTSAGTQGVVVPAPNAVTPVVPVLVDTDAITAAFNACGRDLNMFREAYTVARIGWVDLEPGAFDEIAFACAQAISDAGVSRAEFLDVLVSDLDTDEVPSASVFSAGVLARAREFDVLNSVGGARVRTILDAQPGLGAEERSPIARGAAGRLVTMAESPSIDLEGWSAAAVAFGTQHTDLTEEALAIVIEWLLREPSDDPVDALALMDRCVQVRRWTPDDASLLLAWWGDASIPLERVAMLSRALEKYGVLGLDRSIVLESDATPADRRASGEAIARRMGLTGEEAATDAFSVAWGNAVLAIDAQSGGLASHAALLLRASDYALLNAAAALHWSGDSAGAVALIERVVSDDESSQPSQDVFNPSRLTSSTALPDGAWGMRYLSARKSEDDRLALLTELRASGGIAGPADADVLARAAVIGSSRAVRGAAQNAVRAFADDPFVINGLLESIHAAASQPDVGDVLSYVVGEALPSSGSSGWRDAAHRALSERLAEVVLADATGAIDRAERTMREAYGVRLRSFESRQPDTAPVSDPVRDTLGNFSRTRTPDRTLTGICADVWGAWHQRARRVPEGGWAPRPLASIERRREARTGYGTGVLQRFTLAQIGLVEIMGYQTSAERPGDSGEIEFLIRDLEKAWRDTERVSAQVLLSERAMCSIWALRMGTPLASGGGS